MGKANSQVFLPGLIRGLLLVQKLVDGGRLLRGAHQRAIHHHACGIGDVAGRGGNDGVCQLAAAAHGRRVHNGDGEFRLRRPVLAGVLAADAVPYKVLCFFEYALALNVAHEFAAVLHSQRKVRTQHRAHRHHQHQQRGNRQKVGKGIINKVPVSAHAAHHISHALAGHGAALFPLCTQHGAQVAQPLAQLAPRRRKVFPHGAQKACRKAAQRAQHQQNAVKYPQHGVLARTRKAQQRIFRFKADIIQHFAHAVPKGKGRKNFFPEPGRFFTLWRRCPRPLSAPLCAGQLPAWPEM